MDQSTKTCRGCGTEKALELFSRHPQTRDGRNSSCKACDSARLKKRGEYYKSRAKVVPEEKFCKKCSKRKPQSAFSRASRNLDGLSYSCKECRNAADIHRRATDPEYRERNRARLQELYADQPTYLNYRYSAKYGITLAEYEQMLQAQGGGCAVCGVLPKPGAPRHPVDHDHSCCPGKKSCGQCVRGVLCVGCNQGIGKFKDSPEILLSAVEYLQQS